MSLFRFQFFYFCHSLLSLFLQFYSFYPASDVAIPPPHSPWPILSLNITLPLFYNPLSLPLLISYTHFLSYPSHSSIYIALSHPSPMYYRLSLYLFCFTHYVSHDIMFPPILPPSIDIARSCSRSVSLSPSLDVVLYLSINLSPHSSSFSVSRFTLLPLTNHSPFAVSDTLLSPLHLSYSFHLSIECQNVPELYGPGTRVYFNRLASNRRRYPQHWKVKDVKEIQTRLNRRSKKLSVHVFTSGIISTYFILLSRTNVEKLMKKT